MHATRTDKQTEVQAACRDGAQLTQLRRLDMWLGHVSSLNVSISTCLLRLKRPSSKKVLMALFCCRFHYDRHQYSAWCDKDPKSAQTMSLCVDCYVPKTKSKAPHPPRLQAPRRRFRSSKHYSSYFGCHLSNAKDVSVLRLK
mmetsp:Transcript_21511/g.35493  ORF Transcript_21511/g.35493 Transcript_21511/m.35493 type:complete len:142 (+) Transcript_21511:87-512(+)